MNLWHAIVYGLVQGFSEFLPISSSGHLLITPKILGVADPGAGFTAVIQLGTLLATFVYFWNDLKTAFLGWVRSIANKELRDTPEGRLGWAAFWGTIPIFTLGLAFKKLIVTDARDLRLTATLLIVFGLLLYASEKLGKANRGLEDVKVSDGIWMGIWQSCALMPGASRSGSSMTGGMFCGLERAAAARLSFVMSVPAILASGLFELIQERDHLMQVGLLPTVVATVVSFASGMGAIAFLIAYLKSKPTTIFVVYRVIVGVILFALIANGTWQPR